MSPNETQEQLGDSEEFHYWIDARRLSPEEVDELAKRYDADERHCLAAKRNPHDD